MKFRSEAKIGLIGIITLAVLIWGINYLKGKNILNRDITLFALYAEASGLEEDADIFYKGYKIGVVKEVRLNPQETYPIQVSISIEKNFKIPAGSVAELYSADLLGNKAIRVIPSTSGTTMENNDTINSRIVPDMLSDLQAQIEPMLGNLSELSKKLDSISNYMIDFLQTGKVDEIISRIRETTDIISASFQEGGLVNETLGNVESITSNLEDKNEAISESIENIKTLTDSLARLAGDSVLINLAEAAESLTAILNAVNDGQGTLGNLVYNDSLYINLEWLARDLDHLVRDLKENPEDYVSISVFGGSKKK